MCLEKNSDKFTETLQKWVNEDDNNKLLLPAIKEQDNIEINSVIKIINDADIYDHWRN